MTQSFSEPLPLNLLGLSLEKMTLLFQSWGESSFRGKQVIKWIHQHGMVEINEMTNLSLSLREKLKAHTYIMPPKVTEMQVSVDGTKKWLVGIDGGSQIEMVLIPDKGRNTLCISSQVGCKLDCSFCSTGKQGFNRNLTSAEIIGQLWLAKQELNDFTHANRQITNVVMMGMGEPLLNFDNVIDAVQLMTEDNAYGLSKRRVTISTAGVVPAIDRLSGFVDVSLAISLHAANDELRNQLVPLNRKYPISMLLNSSQKYIEQMPDNKRRLTIEYTLIKNINDSSSDAHQLAMLLKNIPCKINLIPFNPFSLSDYQRPKYDTVVEFQNILINAGYIVNVRSTRGDDINAACGQLAGSVLDKTKRQQRYVEKQIQLTEVN